MTRAPPLLPRPLEVMAIRIYLLFIYQLLQSLCFSTCTFPFHHFFQPRINPRQHFLLADIRCFFLMQVFLQLLGQPLLVAFWQGLQEEPKVFQGNRCFHCRSSYNSMVCKGKDTAISFATQRIVCTFAGEYLNLPNLCC